MKLALVTFGILLFTSLSSCKKNPTGTDPVLPISYLLTYVDSTGDFMYQYDGPMDNASVLKANEVLKERFRFENQTVKFLKSNAILIEDTSGIHFHCIEIQWIPVSYSDTSVLIFGFDSNAADTIRVINPRHLDWTANEIKLNQEFIVRNNKIEQGVLYTHPAKVFNILLIKNHKIFKK